MGQFLGNKNAYFDVLADPSHRYLAALNYTGALLMWEWKEQKFSLIECFNGHSNAVKGLEWNHSGDFLVSASKDQTTRVIALNAETKTYHEISSAQIHGYDINAVTVVKVKASVIDLIGGGMGRSDSIYIIGFAVAPGTEVTIADPSNGFKFKDISYLWKINRNFRSKNLISL